MLEDETSREFTKTPYVSLTGLLLVFPSLRARIYENKKDRIFIHHNKLLVSYS